MILFLIMVFLATVSERWQLCWELAASRGRCFVAAAVVGAAAGLTLRIVSICSTALFSVSVSGLLLRRGWEGVCQSRNEH